MKLQGEHRFNSTRETVWNALLDPDALRAAIPGCQSLTETGPDAYDMTVKVGLGGLRLMLTGQVAMVDCEPPTHYTLRGDGEARAGAVRGGARIELSPDGDGTLLTYVGDVHARGAIARLGSRLIRSTANLMVKRFFTAIDGLLAEAAAERVQSDA